MNLLYCNNINGEGSSIVAFGLIKAFWDNPSESSLLITSNKSILNNYLCYSDGNNVFHILGFSLVHLNINYPNNYHFKTPQWSRNSIIAACFKLLFPLFFFKIKTLTMDDYPFLLARNQVLFFQQSNLLDSSSLKWKIRKIIFWILCISKPVVFLQTPFTERLFNKNFPSLKTFSMIIDYD